MKIKFSPLINALAALAYIGLVVSFLRYIETIRHDTPDTILDGLGFLSLFTFSAVVMGFLFFSQPLLLLFEHKQAEAVTYFVKTLAYFGAITVAILTVASFQ